MTVKNRLLILISKFLFYLIKLFKLGSGSTWPGNLIILINKKFIKEIIDLNPNLKIILVSGTNGKTTTSALITYILKKSGYKVFNNAEGANLINGIASSLISKCTYKGKINYDVAVFEIDENSLHLILKQINPFAVVILNLFRDQLDRYGEVNSISEKWERALLNLSNNNNVYLNGDDPKIYHLGNNLKAKVKYFGLSDDYLNNQCETHDVDSTYCPECKNKLKYFGYSYSHLGNYYCDCGFKRKNILTIKLDKNYSSIQGIFSYYNITASSILLNDLFSISLNNFNKLIKKFVPVFGRQEKIEYKNRNFYLYLSKNPVGLNQSINTALSSFKSKNNIIWFLLNDRIPDGRDISWIWDTDVEKLSNNKIFFVSGDRMYDMVLRLKYADLKVKFFSKNLNKTIEMIVKNSKYNDNIIVFPTYTAMLDLRKEIVGSKFL